MLGEQFDILTLRALPLFAPLSDAELELLRPALAVETRNVGDVLIQEGDAGDVMFVLLLGEAKVVSSHRSENEKIQATLSPIESFGDMSLISGEVRSATVVCTETCRLLSLRRSGLEEVLLQHPAVCLHMLQDAHKKLRAALPSEKLPYS
jgi:CRP/FNR family cyclic AMP-dependent transcriptional regulator